MTKRIIHHAPLDLKDQASLGLEHEIGIDWLQDPSTWSYSYIREGKASLTAQEYRQQSERDWRQSAQSGDRILGYAVLDCSYLTEKHERREGVSCRVFWLKKTDRDFMPRGPYRNGHSMPADAIDPSSAKAGQWGRRSWDVQNGGLK